jgi:hypothetical protein
MKNAEACRPEDKECLTVQALRAWAGAKPGLVWQTGEETYVWHREGHGENHGEWFLGVIRSYDPVRVAHFLQFSRVKFDGTREAVPENNAPMQLWRSFEYLSLKNPSLPKEDTD